MTEQRDVGQELIDSIVSGPPAGVELDERGAALLDLAAAQSRELQLAVDDIESWGYLVAGSRGSARCAPRRRSSCYARSLRAIGVLGKAPLRGVNA